MARGQSGLVHVRVLIAGNPSVGLVLERMLGRGADSTETPANNAKRPRRAVVAGWYARGEREHGKHSPAFG